MGLDEYLKCPGLERTLAVIPEIRPCPVCGEEVEIWTDEKKRKCSNCGSMAWNDNYPFPDMETGDAMKKPGSESIAEQLIPPARSLGATDAAIICADLIPIEQELAGMCLEPRCSNYGLSPSCPPHVSGPDGFRRFIKESREALALKIDVPLEIFYSSQRKELGRLLHEIVAGVEKSAVAMGFAGSRGFAGGSCKNLFCSDHLDCRVLKEGAECRHPDSARPSMSGFGINVAKLMKTAGLTYNLVFGQEEKTPGAQGTLVGLVLLG